MSDRHPLDDALNVDASEEVRKIFGMDLKIPDDPTMKDVVLFALDQYKDLVNESKLLEPEQRIPQLELAKQYLDLAKDTMYKESDLQIKHKNAEIRERQKAPKSLPSGESGEEGSGSVARISRDELIERRKKKKSPT